MNFEYGIRIHVNAKLWRPLTVAMESSQLRQFSSQRFFCRQRGRSSTRARNSAQQLSSSSLAPRSLAPSVPIQYGPGESIFSMPASFVERGPLGNEVSEEGFPDESLDTSSGDLAMDSLRSTSSPNSSILAREMRSPTSHQRGDLVTLMQQQQALLREVLAKQEEFGSKQEEFGNRLSVMEEQVGKLQDQMESDQTSTSSASASEKLKKTKVSRELTVSKKCIKIQTIIYRFPVIVVIRPVWFLCTRHFQTDSILKRGYTILKHRFLTLTCIFNIYSSLSSHNQQVKAEIVQEILASPAAHFRPDVVKGRYLLNVIYMYI